MSNNSQKRYAEVMHCEAPNVVQRRVN